MAGLLQKQQRKQRQWRRQEPLELPARKLVVQLPQHVCAAARGQAGRARAVSSAATWEPPAAPAAILGL